MNLFEKEILEYARHTSSGFAALERDKASIDLIEELATSMREENILNSYHCCVHDHYFPARIELWINVVFHPNKLPRLVKFMCAFLVKNNGTIGLIENPERNAYSIQIEGMHEISISFEHNKEFTREMLADALTEQVTA